MKNQPKPNYVFPIYNYIRQTYVEFGFAIMQIRRDSMDVTFYGYQPGHRGEFRVIYETTVRAGG